MTKYNNVIYLAYKRKYISENAVLPDSTVRKFYDENQNYFRAGDEMNVQEIIVKDKGLADSLLIKIMNGADFGSVAEKYSIRDWSAKNKGIMGFAERSKYGMLKDTLWNSDINKIVGPLRIQNLFGIFKVL